MGEQTLRERPRLGRGAPSVGNAVGPRCRDDQKAGWLRPERIHRQGGAGWGGGCWGQDLFPSEKHFNTAAMPPRMSHVPRHSSAQLPRA